MVSGLPCHRHFILMPYFSYHNTSIKMNMFRKEQESNVFLSRMRPVWSHAYSHAWNGRGKEQHIECAPYHPISLANLDSRYLRKVRVWPGGFSVRCQPFSYWDKKTFFFVWGRERGSSGGTLFATGSFTTWGWANVFCTNIRRMWSKRTSTLDLIQQELYNFPSKYENNWKWPWNKTILSLIPNGSLGQCRHMRYEWVWVWVHVCTWKWESSSHTKSYAIFA